MPGGPQATTYPQGDSTCVTHTGCAAPATLCTVEGGVHTWPAGLVPQDPFGKTTQGLDASREMWRSFAGHVLPLP